MRRVAATLVVLWGTLAAAVDLRGALSRAPGTFQSRSARFDLPSRAEREICQVVTLPNGRAVDVDQIVVDTPARDGVVSHHFAMFLVADPTAPGLPTVPVDSVGCAGVGGEIVSPILAFTQAPRQRIRFPKGVAVTLSPRQPLLFNPHYVNAGDDPATVDVLARFHKARRARVRHHARSFQLGTFDIDVPPRTEGRAVATWTTPFPMNVVWLSTHSHKYTVTAEIEVLRAGVSEGVVVQTDDWAEPQVNVYPAPYLRLAAGDGLRWTCNYRNDRDVRLHFGVTADDEMCFAVGFFFTDDDRAPLPAVPGCFGNGAGLVCPAN